MPVVDDLSLGRALSGPLELDPRSRVPLPAGRASLGSRRRSPISATDNDARAHPTSLRSSHASGAVAPLRAGTNRCRLRRPAMRRRIEDLRATNCTRRLAHVAFPEHRTCSGRSRRRAPLRGWSRSRAEAPERRHRRAVGRRRACPPRWRPEHPASPARLVAKPGVLRAVTHRPRPTADDASRKATPLERSGCLRPRRNPYASGELSLRARPNRSSVTPPPQRHCSRARAPFLPPSHACL